MKCQILFSGKNKKNNIILSSAENAQRVVKVNNVHSLKFTDGVSKGTDSKFKPGQLLGSVCSGSTLFALAWPPECYGKYGNYYEIY